MRYLGAMDDPHDDWYAQQGQPGDEGRAPEYDRRMLQALATGATIFATTIAFFSTPLLRFVDPGQLALTGFIFAVGGSAVWFSTLLGDRDRFSLLFNILIAFAGVIGILSAIGSAWYASAMNDERCLTIEKLMLSPRPYRSDLPDLFTALGCRPRGGFRLLGAPIERARTSRKLIP